MQKQLKTPVLFLTFNRFENTKKVFAEIKKAKPKKLFIAADGPRNSEEKEKTDAVRKYILKNINWKCDVKTLFREKNLGCKYAVAGAIDWFFENVEQGIILEDDCLPNQSFFRFCEELLDKYEDEEKVLSITGYNYLDKSNIKNSYFFSRYFECWGWATWRRVWKRHNATFKGYKRYRKKKSLGLFYNHFEKIIYMKRFDGNLKGITSSWAIPLTFFHFKEHGYCITPKNSLIKNIGLEKDATHTKENFIDRRFFINKVIKIEFPLKHPKEVSYNKRLINRYLAKEFFRIIFKRLNLFYNKWI